MALGTVNSTNPFSSSYRGSQPPVQHWNTRKPPSPVPKSTPTTYESGDVAEAVKVAVSLALMQDDDGPVPSSALGRGINTDTRVQSVSPHLHNSTSGRKSYFDMVAETQRKHGSVQESKEHIGWGTESLGNSDAGSVTGMATGDVVQAIPHTKSGGWTNNSPTHFTPLPAASQPQRHPNALYKSNSAQSSSVRSLGWTLEDASGASRGSRTSHGSVVRSRSCHDVGCAMAFLANVAGVIALAVLYGVDELTTPTLGFTVAAADHGMSPAVLVWLVGGVALVLAVPTVLVFVWLLRRHGTRLVKCFIYAAGVFLLLQGVAMAVTGHIAVGIMFGLSGLLLLYLAWTSSSSVRQAAATLATALAAFDSKVAPFGVAMVLALVQLLWCAMWSIAAAGIAAKIGKYFVLPLLLPLYWGIQVIRHVTTVTTCGAVGAQWFSIQAAAAMPTVWGLGIALSSSFGSICFGGAVLGTIQTLRALTRFGRSSASVCSVEQVLACCVGCCLSTFQGFVDTCTRFSFVYVALNGTSFVKSGQQVVALFKQRGYSSLMADTLINMSLMIMTVLVAVLCGLACGVVTMVFVDSELFTLGAVAGFGFGFAIASNFTEVAVASSVTVLVAFVAKSEALRADLPVEHAEMVNAWRAAQSTSGRSVTYTATKTRRSDDVVSTRW